MTYVAMVPNKHPIQAHGVLDWLKNSLAMHIANRSKRKKVGRYRMKAEAGTVKKCVHRCSSLLAITETKKTPKT
jgi:hypothetical protein